MATLRKRTARAIAQNGPVITCKDANTKACSYPCRPSCGRVCSLCYCLRLTLRRPHQHQCQQLCRRRSGSCCCCCTHPRETVASPSFHGAACSSSGNCHCDGGIGADVGAGVDVSESVSDNNIEKRTHEQAGAAVSRLELRLCGLVSSSMQLSVWRIILMFL